MTTGIVLLTQNNYYLSESGNLPKRPDYDKVFLTALVKGQEYICGEGTYKDLPPSIIQNAQRVHNCNHDVNLGIITFYKQPPHLLFVMRSDEVFENGKQMDSEFFELYTKVFEGNSLEIHIKN